MTIRQIAETAGCNINTVRTLGKKMFPMVKQIKKGLPIEYTEKQVISLMNKLPKKNFIADPTNIDTPTSTNISTPLDNSSTMMMQMFKSIMDQQKQQQEQQNLFMTHVLNEIKNVSSPVLQIEQPKEDYFSLLAYCTLHNIKTNRSELAMHGRELRKMVLSKKLELKKIPDERYGEVNSYPVIVLDEYFAI